MNKSAESLKAIPPKDSVLPQHIIDTYFYKKPHKSRHGKLAHKKTNVIPTIVVSLGIMILMLGIAKSFLTARYNAYLMKKFENSKLVTLFDEGSINKDVIKRFEFRGQAKDKSKVADKVVYLTNPKKYNWADLSMGFRFPANLSGRILSLSLRGKTGGEKVSLVLRDADNRSSILNDIFLTPGWKTESMPFDKIKGDINLSRVDLLRLECSYVGEPPKEMGAASIDTTFYIKDIRISKKDIL